MLSAGSPGRSGPREGTADSVRLCSQVRSFGTEDRPTDRPAPPREEIYEYIIFRGSDIKDITVCEPPKAPHTLPQDPAIVQVSGPPVLGAGAGGMRLRGERVVAWLARILGGRTAF